MVSLGPVCAKLHQATKASWQCNFTKTAPGLRMIIAKSTGGERACTRQNNYKHAKRERFFPLSFCFLHPHTHSRSRFLSSSVVCSNLMVVFKAFSFSAVILFLLILWRLLSKAPLYPSLGLREQQQPSSNLQQSFSFILAYSPSPPHAVLSAAPNSSICPAGPWQEESVVFLQPNFDWLTSSSYPRVLYFFPFLACTK